MKRSDAPFPQEVVSGKQLWKRTAIAFLVFAVLIIAGWKTFDWIKTQPKVNGRPKPLRAALNTNEKIFSKLFDTAQLVKEYPLSAAATNVRVNGNLGLRGGIDTTSWRLQVVRKSGDTLKLTLDDIKALPKRDIVFDFKCIEGWSQVTHWAGVPLKSFMDHYHLQGEEQLKYVGLQTPDRKYYVGID